MENNVRAIPVDPDYLAGLLRRAMEAPSLQVREWDLQRLSGGLELGSSIYRLHGAAAVEGRPDQDWSLILKAIQPDAEWNDPQACRYWKREPQAYRSGLLHALPGPVRAPRCYDVQDQPDGSVWIWMEDVQDAQGHPWPLERYAQVARQLGQFNGAYLAGRPLPGEDWLTRDWLRNYLDHAAPMVAFVRQNPAHPIVRAMLPGMTLPLTFALWHERERMLRVLDDLPQTFCHQDAFARNLFYRRGQVVALDWGYAGIAPVGAELAPLIGVACTLGRFPSDQAQAVDQACFAGYLDGLRQAGWEPDARQVRLGFAVSMLLRYILGATIGELLPGLLDAATREHWVEGMGSSQAEAGQTDAAVAAYYQAIALEALKLLGPGSMLRVAGHTARHAIRLAGARRGAPQATS